MKIVSFILKKFSEAGHHFHYHQSIGRAANFAGLEHSAVIAKDLAIGTPDGWIPFLRIIDTSLYKNKIKKLYFKILNSFHFFTDLINLKKKFHFGEKGENERIIYFLESFTSSFLIGFLLFVLFSNSNFSVLILYRYASRQEGFYGKIFGLRNYIYKIANRFFLWKLGGKFKILTDSDLLAVSFEKLFHQKIYCMPIPHTHLTRTNFSEKKERILCWWPGPPRTTKGLSVIRSLVALKKNVASEFELIFAKSASISSVEGGVRIRELCDILSKHEYENMMNTSDFIFLPYDPAFYAEATSGIFVESVVMGKIPLVTDHTWMAWELKKHFLEELIVDWNTEDFFENAKKIFENKEIRTKLQKMQESYSLFHNEVSFGNHMKQLIESP